MGAVKGNVWLGRAVFRKEVRYREEEAKGTKGERRTIGPLSY